MERKRCKSGLFHYSDLYDLYSKYVFSSNKGEGAASQAKLVAFEITRHKKNTYINRTDNDERKLHVRTPRATLGFRVKPQHMGIAATLAALLHCSPAMLLLQA